MTDPRSGVELSASADADETGRARSRADLLKISLLVGGSVLGAGGLATALARGQAASPTARDGRILNYVLRLERLKEAFYREAVLAGALTGELQQLAAVFARHEAQHVAFFTNHLGEDTEARKTYEFGEAIRDPKTFAATARKLEETAVAAFIGEGANLTHALMVPFAEVCSVEARHAAWIADMLRSDPAPRAADEVKTPADVLSVIDELGFETSD